MNAAQTATVNLIKAAVQAASGTVATYEVPNVNTLPLIVKVNVPPSTIISLTIDVLGNANVITVT